ncbi:LysM peptidoglycan-binding domain-containing protein [Nocardioides alcanivorans]|uniref:LysM peptidoglycan-binding domain-containing protein n=1 Tax=Nocardioides alcanivorans TaxID=2897352 RepID=UPI001F277339|nr:LysM peptidoglycan-binding domain-containing protein [Nocardioides alcanivorans]
MSTVALHSTPTRRQLQLTRRGRAVVFIAAAVLVLIAAVFLGATSVATADEGGSATATRVIMVDEGDTLWAIAADLAEDGEVREMIDTIKRINALDSSALQVGQEIHVPA